MRSASTGNPPPTAAQPECRFCLEPGATPKNPLITPCPCNGSVRYVHWSCLKRWVRLDAANARACTICRQPFDAAVFPGFISMEAGPHAAQLFLQHSSWANLAITYGAFMWRANEITTETLWVECWEISRLGSLWTHAAYAVCALLCWRGYGLQEREAYWAALPRARAAGMLGGHAYALYLLLVGASPDYLAAAIMQILLRIYWQEHNAIIARVNARLLADFTR